MDETTKTEFPFSDVPVELTVSVGHARPTIGQLMALRPQAVLPLDRAITDPVEIFVGDKLVAVGILQEIGEGEGRQLAVRLTDVSGLPGDA